VEELAVRRPAAVQLLGAVPERAGCELGTRRAVAIGEAEEQPPGDCYVRPFPGMTAGVLRPRWVTSRTSTNRALTRVSATRARSQTALAAPGTEALVARTRWLHFGREVEFLRIIAVPKAETVGGVYHGERRM
jgi:hypothetical protein